MISGTSYVEQANLTMRMHMRRFTRERTASAKKIENHIAALALHFMHYNFVRIHQTLRVTPAMAAGVIDRLWNIADIVTIHDRRLDRQEPKPRKPEYSWEPFGPVLGHGA